jgi:predicted DNA-binding ribbon-helix-helix protein
VIHLKKIDKIQASDFIKIDALLAKLYQARQARKKSARFCATLRYLSSKLLALTNDLSSSAFHELVRQLLQKYPKTCAN